jgi:transposase
VVVEIKAMACELPKTYGLPLSRFSAADLAREAISRGIVASISGATIWRWLHQDALHPWQYRSWIFPRDPDFAVKAGRVLDLYARRWEGEPLGEEDFVLCADEKTSIQVRARRHGTRPPQPGTPGRVEHEYRRGGAVAYLAAWDVHRAKLFGRCEAHTGIGPFDQLIAQVMTEPPYASARRVFLITDNSSSHRGPRYVARLRERWPTLIPAPLPIHASWLNQVEIYFSILQRKALTPSNFSCADDLTQTILQFQRQYEVLAKPFEWKFTRQDLASLLAKLPSRHAAA